MYGMKNTDENILFLFILFRFQFWTYFVNKLHFNYTFFRCHFIYNLIQWFKFRSGFSYHNFNKRNKILTLTYENNKYCCCCWWWCLFLAFTLHSFYYLIIRTTIDIGQFDLDVQKISNYKIILSFIDYSKLISRYKIVLRTFDWNYYWLQDWMWNWMWIVQFTIHLKAFKTFSLFQFSFQIRTDSSNLLNKNTLVNVCKEHKYIWIIYDGI